MTYAPAFLTSLEAMVPGLRPNPSPIARALSALHAAHARRQAIRDYTRLLQVEDHLLDDIGISRSDVRRALRDCKGR
jgi:uncharacterized protein YjiS (DUF1127 family)